MRPVLLDPAQSRLPLPGVTLVAVTSVAVPQTVRAMTLSLDQVAFGEAVLFSDRRPNDLPAAIRWQPIAPIASRAAYSRFMLRDLAGHVATGHALCVQWDGYVLNARAWDPAFLDHDYIGAAWPHFNDGRDVGNGGFSLRSRRLLDACGTLDIDETAEDVAICRVHRGRLERDFDIRFAPVALARRFAFERYDPTGGEFGFHGAFNLGRLMPPNELAGMLGAIEPGLLNRREHRDLLRAALRRGQFALAATIVRRMYSRGARIT